MYLPASVPLKFPLVSATVWGRCGKCEVNWRGSGGKLCVERRSTTLVSRQSFCFEVRAAVLLPWARCGGVCLEKVTATEHTARTLSNMHHSWAASGWAARQLLRSRTKKVPVGFLWRRFDAEFSASEEFLKVLAPGAWKINNIYSKDAGFKLRTVHVLHTYLHECLIFILQVFVLYLTTFWSRKLKK